MAQHDVNITIKGRDMATGALNGVGSSLKRLAGVALGAFSLYKVYGVIKQSIGDFMEAEAATRRLGDALANLGVRSELPALKEFSKQLGLMSAIDDDNIQKTMALGAAMGMHGDTLKAATVSAIGYSAALRIDVESAMKSVGKAAQGNAAIFGRMGVAIDKSKSAQDQFQQVLTKGSSNFHIAQGQTDTLKGGVDSLKNAVEDLRVGFGQFITQILGLPEKLHWVSFAFRNMDLAVQLTKQNILLTMSEFRTGIDSVSGAKTSSKSLGSIVGGEIAADAYAFFAKASPGEKSRGFGANFMAARDWAKRSIDSADVDQLNERKSRIEELTKSFQMKYEALKNPFAPDVFNRGAGLVAGGGLAGGGLAAVRHGGFTLETGTGRLGGGGQNPIETKLDRLIKLQEISNSIEERRLSQETRDSANDFSSDLFESNFQ
jgi:hypothetical protein